MTATRQLQEIAGLCFLPLAIAALVVLLVAFAVAWMLGVMVQEAAALVPMLRGRPVWRCSWCDRWFTGDHRPRRFRPLGHVVGHGICRDCVRNFIKTIPRKGEP